MLTERLQNRQIIRRELFEYPELLNTPTSQWLFVRGNYLKHISQRTLALATKKTFYYFNQLAATE